MALACGNAFLWKPSEKDPTSSLRVAELLMEAGLPAGVLNVINGDKVAVDAILVVAFFVFIYAVVAPHVPSNDGRMVRLWGGLTAACMTGVFWLCIQMFRVVLKAQRESKR